MSSPDYSSLFLPLLVLFFSVSCVSWQSLVQSAMTSADKYDEGKDKDLFVEDDGVKDEAREWIFGAGQSKRIWGELYKVGD